MSTHANSCRAHQLLWATKESIAQTTTVVWCFWTQLIIFLCELRFQISIWWNRVLAISVHFYYIPQQINPKLVFKACSENLERHQHLHIYMQPKEVKGSVSWGFSVVSIKKKCINRDWKIMVQFCGTKTVDERFSCDVKEAILVF